MTRYCSNLRHLVFPLLLALSASFPAIAQQGQYYLTDTPFVLPGMSSHGGLATYSPIKEIRGEMIQLRSDDGTVYTFTLDAKTVYCQGNKKVSDWTYLKNVKKKHSITVMTNDDADTKALIVWDRGPSISSLDGHLAFDLPPMCQ